MKWWIALLSALSVPAGIGRASEPAPNAEEQAKTEVARSLAEMGAAANAHDVERHVAFYARDSFVTLIVNGEPITGWEAIRDRQREWWKNGKTDVVYEVNGRPQFLVLAPDVMLTTLFMIRRRHVDGGVSDIGLAVSAIWKKRPEGWRVIYSHESMSRVPAR